MMNKKSSKTGFSLGELLAVVAILGIVASIIIPRVSMNSDSADVAACFAYKGDIEIQAELWRHNTGDWPAGNLADIGADIDYFPEGLPTCPVDGTPYTIDTATGRVVGHNHP